MFHNYYVFHKNSLNKSLIKIKDTLPVAGQLIFVFPAAGYFPKNEIQF